LAKFRSLCVSTLLCAVLFPNLAHGQNPAHPLDALRTEEYWIAYDVVQSSGRMDEDTHFISVLLHEPDKQAVLAWKPGQNVTREADVTLMRKGVPIEARVDLGAKKLQSWKEVRGAQAAIFISEIESMSDAILADQRVKQALAKRGITDLNMVECYSVPLAYFAYPEQEGHRIGFVDCDVLHHTYHDWGRTVGGLTIEVDLVERKVLQVIDENPLPPSPTTNFEEAPESPRPGTKPAIISQPLGPSFQVNDGEVAWQNWRFRFRLDSRNGVILNLVRFDDNGRLRSVLYEGMVSELFVPYMDATRGWSTHMFVDAGEFYPGGILQSLRAGVDCPSNAEYFDGISTNEKGAPVLHPQQACLFEKFDGNVAWRHGDEGNNVWGRPSRSLVLRSAALIGNYDYLLDWEFQQDGTIRAAVGATGVIETRAVTAESVNGPHASDGVESYGHLVAKNTLGVNHDHFFSYRLDLDVDGQNNSFMMHRLVRKELPQGGPRKSIWVTEPSIAANERDAMMDIHLETPSMWLFVNPNVKGPLGHPTGYEIMPGATAASLLDPEDGMQKVGAFSAHQLWVTPYEPNERYAGGTYPISSKGNDGLAAWTKENRKIENTDIVAWYTLGFHHITREEDWPVMPTMWHDFLIRPFDFFAQNPVLDLPHVP
jgi:primary-amine oxidase